MTATWPRQAPQERSATADPGKELQAGQVAGVLGSAAGAGPDRGAPVTPARPVVDDPQRPVRGGRCRAPEAGAHVPTAAVWQ